MIMPLMESFYGEDDNVKMINKTPFEKTFLKVEIPKIISI